MSDPPERKPSPLAEDTGWPISSGTSDATILPGQMLGQIPTLPSLTPVPRFKVRLQAPDLTPWLLGNAGTPGVIRLPSGREGPHVAITALMHGNEIAGAIVLDELLRQDIRPLRGTLSLCFLNLAAFARFDPAQPTASRFIDEDMNRLWDPKILDSTRSSVELDRARALRPLFETVDFLVDLHSMLWPSDPLILSGRTEKGRRLARALGTPALIVADHGHVGGPRLIDYQAFIDSDDSRAACLVEAGPHWEPATVETTRIATRALLREVGMIEAGPAEALPPAPSRCAEVTRVVTATTGSFSFTQPFRGGQVIPQQGTIIGHDGAEEIRTPHDDCLLVMPSLRPTRGHTTVRLARFLPDPR